MGRVIHGRALVAGDAAGEALVADEPLSFWGGYDQRTGEIIDRRHPLSGRVAAGRVLAVPYARGSSTTTAVLLESIRNGSAPAALLTTGSDSFLSLASIVADEMWDRTVPVVELEPEALAGIASGDRVTVYRDGTVEIEPASEPAAEASAETA